MRICCWVAMAVLAASVSAADAESLTVVLDHAELLRLAKPAEKVIVGNPAIADVTVDSPSLVSVFGKSAGETNLIVLGAKGQVLLSRRLVVAQQLDGGVSVYVPGKDGPTIRAYSCSGGGCLRVHSPENLAGAGAIAPAATPAPASPPPGEQPATGGPDKAGR
jgi:hypothetical protein